MKRKLIVPIAGVVLAGIALWASDWNTDGGDVARTHWQRDEKTISPKNAKDLSLIWKLQLDNKPRAMTSLLTPVIAEKLQTSSGIKQVAVVAGVSDNLYGVDVDAGKVLWQQHFYADGEGPAGGTLCPGGMTDTPYLSDPDAKGRRTIYVMTGEGKLHQVDAANGEEVADPVPFMGPNGKPFSLAFSNNRLFTVNGQYCGRQTNGVWSIDLASPDKKVTVWSTDETDPAWNGTRLFPPGVWGRSGAAIGSDGTVYVGTSDGDWDPSRGKWALSVVALAPDTLKMKDWYTPSNYEWMNKKDLDLNVTPVVFPYKGRDLVAISGKDCRLYLMDSKSLGGADHRTPLDRTPLYCNEDANFASEGTWGTLATWQDSKGTRWILAPFWGPAHPDLKFPMSYGPVTRGGVVAFKLEEKGGKPVLTPVWMSEDMDHGEAPVIANGVVYAYGSGEDTTQAFPTSAGRGGGNYRIEHSTHATLFALDAETGKTLWSSGNQIASWVHSGGLSVANGRVYLGTYDSILYCFGVLPKQ